MKSPGASTAQGGAGSPLTCAPVVVGNRARSLSCIRWLKKGSRSTPGEAPAHPGSASVESADSIDKRKGKARAEGTLRVPGEAELSPAGNKWIS
jgi:hypothetical protein